MSNKVKQKEGQKKKEKKKNTQQLPTAPNSPEHAIFAIARAFFCAKP
jgi:hypothetical protein